MTFTTGFPQADARASEALNPLSSSPTRILLVDDDRVFARSLARSLRGLGFNVEVSNDGAEAMQRLETSYYDAVLLDLEMHPVDGWQVLDLHSKLQEPPAVVVLSGHLDVPRTVRALRAGVTDAYQKPVDTIELAKGLKDAIYKRSGQASFLDPEAEEEIANPIIGHAPAVQVIRSQIHRVARYRDLPVLIVGEAGSGQDLVARTIHALDGNESPFEVIDFGQKADAELEAELFGVAPGGPTSGGDARPGILERAYGGTIFFDNVSESSPALQARLLHLLQTRRYRRIHGTEELTFHARVVSATRRMIREGRIEGMRPDLYYRLAGITVVLPPLRTRMEDIAPLVEHYARLSAAPGNAPKRFSARALQCLHEYDWPGNLDELESVAQHAIRLSKGACVGTREVRAALADKKRDTSRLDPRDATYPIAREATHDSSLPKVERALIIDAFEAAHQNISEAARQLGIPRSTLRDRLKRLGLL